MSRWKDRKAGNQESGKTGRQKVREGRKAETGMLEIGIQSRLILGQEPKEAEFDRIKRAGFDCIDFNLDRFLPNILIYEGNLNHFFDQEEDCLADFFGQYYRMARDAGLRFSQVHAPYPLYVPGQEGNRAYLYGVAEKSIAICAALHAPYLVVHPFKLAYTFGQAEEYRQNLAFFQSLAGTAGRYGVKICLENLYDSVGGRICEGVCAKPRQACAYVDALNQEAGEERFAFCFDTGHANLSGKNLEEVIVTLGERLQALHIHDNDGRGDLHQMPFTFNRELAGEGITDWGGFVRGLKRIGFAGALSFETFGALQCFPEELQESVLGMIAGIGKYFKRELEG